MKIDLPLNNELEALLDKHDMAVVVAALINVCHDKSEHMATNWQDVQSAKVWTRFADALSFAEFNIRHIIAGE